MTRLKMLHGSNPHSNHSQLPSFSQLDQPYFILPGRTYYLEDSQTFQQMKEAYVTYGSKVAALFGADEATARSAMEDVLIFETELANVGSYFVAGIMFFFVKAFLD